MKQHFPHATIRLLCYLVLWLFFITPTSSVAQRLVSDSLILAIDTGNLPGTPFPFQIDTVLDFRQASCPDALNSLPSMK